MLTDKDKSITLGHLKRLASAMNHKFSIKGISKMKKDELMSALKAKKYEPKYSEKKDTHELRPITTHIRPPVIKADKPKKPKKKSKPVAPPRTKYGIKKNNPIMDLRKKKKKIVKKKM
tara:strand:- start:1076 stop:1429 length:354 start_codon:yes stop_codon:yes gene_type:complete